MKRPLIPVALLYVAGILLAALPVGLVPLFLCSFGLAVLFAAWPAARAVCLSILIILTGWINLGRRTAVLSPNDLRKLAPPEVLASVRGVLSETPARHVHQETPPRHRSYTNTIVQLDVREVSLKNADWQPAFGRILVNTTGDLSPDFYAGQSVQIVGVLKSPPGPLAPAPGLFDYRNYLANQGIYYELSVKKTSQWQIIGAPVKRPLADRFRAWARNDLALGLPAQDESLYLEWALTLGWRTALTDDVADPFIKAATYHIFAVDGLRIAIVSGILLGLMRALGLPRAYCAVLTVPFLLFYAAMTGWPASAIRAIVMILVVFGGWILKRPSDLLNSLFAAALIILLWEPRQLFQAGFQLSFFVVLCIILILPFFNQIGERVLKPDPLVPESLQPRWKKILLVPAVWTLDVFLVSLAAWLGSIPLAAWYFHILTPSSGPANVIAVPLCGLVLICNLASLFLGAWLPFLAELFNHAGWLLMNCIRVTSQWSAHWPAAYFYVPMPGFFTIGLYYFALLSLLTGWLFKGRYRIWKISSLIALCIVWGWLWLYQRPITRLTILPLEDGCGAYLQSNHSADDWLIDCGNQTAAETITTPFLHASGVNRLSHLVLTHGGINYAGGATNILKEFRPRAVLLNPILSHSPDYRAVTEFVRTNYPRQPVFQPGDHLGPWTLLHPDSARPSTRADDNAIVLLGDIQGVRVLLLSSLSRAGQVALLSRTNDLHADLLIAAVTHFEDNSDSPLSGTLLNAVQPRVIIIHDSSAHSGNEQLHDQLSRRGVPVLYTRQTRAVTLTTRPGSWQLTAMDGTAFSSDTRPSHR